jgi:uncharacterized membrane protein
VRDVFQVLGSHLVVGDWATSLPLNTTRTIGLVGMLVLGVIVLSLWKNGKKRRLKIALVMGILPLFLALGIDTIAQKFTLGFGWGRALICILPGCLLLITLGIEQSGRWRAWLATSVLLVYLTIDISDFSLRQRQVFHQVANILQQNPAAPTLVIINSQAWGHINRLAYYVPATVPVSLLAQPSANLATALEKALTQNASLYQRVLWLESELPLWSPPTNPVERQQVEKVLSGCSTGPRQSNCFQLTKAANLSGTMDLDGFSLKLYTRSSPSLSNP